MRVGVVGTGFGAAVHVPALRRIEGVDVVVLAGSDRARARVAAETLGVPVGCGSVDELLEHRLDAVTVAVPPDRQPDVAASLLSAGVPVLAEKPLAATVEAAEELATLGHGVTTAIDFEFAELASFKALRHTIAGGSYGTTRSVDVVWRTRPRPGGNRPDWKADAGRGGGVLALLGSHVLYLLEWLLGPIEITAAHAPGESPATRLALTCVAGDVPVSVALDNHSGEQRHEWRIDLDEGTLTAANPGLDAVRGFRLLAGSGTLLAAEPEDLHPDGRVAPVAALATRFLGAVAEGRPMRPDFGDGLRVQRLLAHVERSRAVTR